MEIFIAFTISLFSTIIAYIASYLKKKERKGKTVQIQFMTPKPEISQSKTIVEDISSKSYSTEELIRQMGEQLYARIRSSPYISDDEIQNEVEKQIVEVRERIQKIEERFPEEAKIEKISSINDVLLSERIDQLAKQVENLEKKILSRWDIAKVVGTIITGIIAIVGATVYLLTITRVIS